MIIVKEGLTGKNAADKVKFGGNISKKMTGNLNFPDSLPYVTALDTATTALKKANDDGITSEIEVKENLFNISIKALVLHIQGAILGLADDVAKEKVDSTGFEAKRKGSISIPDLSAEQGEEALSIKLRRKVTTGKRRVAYVWQIATSIGDDAVWTYCKFSTYATVTITGLVSGTRYYFRVAVVIGETLGDYSHITDISVK